MFAEQPDKSVLLRLATVEQISIYAPAVFLSIFFRADEGMTSALKKNAMNGVAILILGGFVH